MKKKIFLWIYIILFLYAHQLLFAQTVDEETSPPSQKTAEEIVKAINETLGLGDIKKIIVFPILNNEPVFASLIAKNLFSKLKEQNIEKTAIKYLFGSETSKKKKLKTILEKYKKQEKYSIAVVVQILETKKTDDVPKYIIETTVYRNISNDLVITTNFEGTRDSILGIQNTSLLDDLENVVSELEQQSSIPDDVSLVYITPKKGDLKKYIIKIDDTELITNDVHKGIAYFPSGKHTLHIYQIITIASTTASTTDSTTAITKDSTTNNNKDVAKTKEILIAKIKTKRNKKEYHKKTSFIDITLEKKNLDIALLLGYQRPFLSKGNTTLENGSVLMELQTNINISSLLNKLPANINISSLPLYFGLSIYYTPLNNINSIMSTLPNSIGDKTAIRQMIAPLLRVGYTHEIMKERFVINAGLRGGVLSYALPYAEKIAFSSSILPTIGLESSFIQYLTSAYRTPRLYLVEQLAVLFTDLKYATLANVTTSEGIDYIKENNNYFYILPSLSFGLGLNF